MLSNIAATVMNMRTLVVEVLREVMRERKWDEK